MKTFCIKAIAAICSAFFGIALLFTVFKGPGTVGNWKTSPLATVIGMLTLLGVLLLLLRHLPRQAKRMRQLGFVMFVLIGVGLIATCCLISAPFSTDLRYCHSAAMSLVETGSINLKAYLAKYEHQQPLTLLLALLYKIALSLGVTNTVAVGEGFHIVCILCSALCAAWIASRLFSRRTGLLTLCLFALSPIFYLYAPRFYNDLPACAFALLAAVCVLQGDDHKGVRALVFYAASGLLLCVAIQLRATMAILLIAYVIALPFAKGVRRSLAILAPVLSGLVIGLLIFSLLLARFGVSDDALRFPLTHWLMLGSNLNTFGTYNAANHNATYAVTGVAQKTALNLSVIAAQLGEMSIIDLITLLLKKLTIVWSDGAFSIEHYMGSSETYGAFWELFYGARSAPIMLLCQISYGVALLGMVLYALRIFFHPLEADGGMVFLLGMAGAGAFYLLWEANARYGLSFLPWMLLLCAQGYTKLGAQLTHRATHDRVAYSALACAMAVTLLSGCAFITLSRMNPVQYNEQAALQKAKSDQIALDGDLTQTFTADSSYDHLRLSFLSSDATGQYKIAIYDLQSQAPRWELLFSGADITASQHTFTLPGALPKGQYLLRLSCIAQDSAAPPLVVMGATAFDTYGAGVCTKNGIIIGDIAFDAYLGRYGTLFSTKQSVFLFGSAALLQAALWLYYFIDRRKLTAH